MTIGHVTRRNFVKVSAASASLLATQASGIVSAAVLVRPAGTKLRVLRAVNFPTKADAEFARQAQEASKMLGAQVEVETVFSAFLAERIKDAISSGGGPDLIEAPSSWIPVYASALADVSDVAEPVGQARGGFYEFFGSTAKLDGRWLAVPHAAGIRVISYRRSWYAAAGAGEFPGTWEAWRETGKKLKAAGRPMAPAFAPPFGDASAFCYPLLWAFGGVESPESINSRNTIESLKFMRAFRQEVCAEPSVPWNDMSCTLNGPSHYRFARNCNDGVWKDLDHALPPGGPSGQFALASGSAHALMKYSRNAELAKEFLRWLHARENYTRWLHACDGSAAGSATDWEKHALWSGADEPMQIFRRSASHARAADPRGGDVIVNMYQKAAQGIKAEDAVQRAEEELKTIYAS